MLLLSVIRVQIWNGMVGACCMNGEEYKYVQGWENVKDHRSHVIEDSSCLGSDTLRFMKFV
jgi:hypothetical protein